MSPPFTNDHATTHILPTATAARSPLDSWRMRIFLIVLCAGFLLVNFLVFPTSTYDNERFSLAGTWDHLFLGGVVVEFGLLAAFAVLGTGRTIVRQLLVVVLMMLLIGSTMSGLFLKDTMVGDVYVLPSQLAIPFLYLLPAILLACEFPLWMLRLFLGWRIEPPWDHENSSPKRITIAGLLLTTAAVGLSLACVRLGRQMEGDATESRWWEYTIVAMICASAVSAVVLPVVIYCMLRWRSLWVATAVVVAPTILFWVFWLFCAAASLTFGEDFQDLQHAASDGLLLTGVSVGLLVPLLGFRLAGYRLTTRLPKAITFLIALAFRSAR